MDEDVTELTHLIKAAPGTPAPLMDLKITELGTGEEETLPNNGGYDSALIFERALAEIFGREEAVTGLYCKAESRIVTRATVERIRSAYAMSFDH